LDGKPDRIRRFGNLLERGSVDLLGPLDSPVLVALVGLRVLKRGKCATVFGKSALRTRTAAALEHHQVRLVRASGRMQEASSARRTDAARAACPELPASLSRLPKALRRQSRRVMANLLPECHLPSCCPSSSSFGAGGTPQVIDQSRLGLPKWPGVLDRGGMLKVVQKGARHPTLEVAQTPK
jgi:hypothetical protein